MLGLFLINDIQFEKMKNGKQYYNLCFLNWVHVKSQSEFNIWGCAIILFNSSWFFTWQSYWKGYLARKDAKGQLVDLRLRMQKSAANVDDSRRLINRLVSAVSELLNMRSLSGILHTCATLGKKIILLITAWCFWVLNISFMHSSLSLAKMIQMA